VPLIWEKFHAGVTAKMGQATGAKKLLVDWTRKVCAEVSAHKNRGEKPGPLLEAQYRVVERLVLQKLKPALGLGRARQCISGAAPIAKDVIEFFAGLDIIVQEIYGQSEDTGPTSFNLPGAPFGSVGRDPRRVGQDASTTARSQGPNVSLGY
jgi:long-chain acyl-CoA synthetase